MKSKNEIREVCTVQDLVAKGYPEHFVRDIITDKRLGLAFKMDASNPKSKWLVFVDKFNAYINENMKMSFL